MTFLRSFLGHVCLNHHKLTFGVMMIVQKHNTCCENHCKNAFLTRETNNYYHYNFFIKNSVSINYSWAHELLIKSHEYTQLLEFS